MSRTTSEGAPEPLGVSVDGDGVNVAIFSAHAEAIDFCLFDAAGARETARIRLPARTGDIFHGHIAGLGEGTRYGLRAHGPYAPEAGHRFNPAKLLVDPHARLLDRPFRLHADMFGFVPGDDSAPSMSDSAPHMPKAIVTGAMAPGPNRVLARWRDTILYELHVRGYTMAKKDVPQHLRGTFAGLAHPAAIDHLVRLGVTAVELMPVAAWIDERHLGPLGLSNYWGYNPVALMAPEPRLAPGGWDEIRRTVEALAGAGIETIVDVVLNHSGEGDALGPTLSLRGLDNATYYRLRPDDPRRYVDDSGCGNTLALDRAPVVRLAMDALRAWVERAGVHGFRFDLATCMGRRPDGFDPQAPLLAAIEQDPLLREVRLIAEAWDIGPGGYQVGRFGGAWGEWNDRFRDDVRSFWRGDSGKLGPLATRLAGSADLFAAKQRPSRSVNFVTAHDGFTLADLVAHEAKHNLANGEDNRDGSNDNASWNNGVEGRSDDPAVIAARRRDQRALLATLLLARGTPMLSMGAELGQSQAGNNNAYAQDNALAWLDWDKADADLIDFTAQLIRLRRALPLLSDDVFLREAEVQWLSPDGTPMTPGEWEAPGGDGLVMLLSSADARLALLVHRGDAARSFRLPEPQGSRHWQLLIDSGGGSPATGPGSRPKVGARSILLLQEQVTG